MLPKLCQIRKMMSVRRNSWSPVDTMWPRQWEGRTLTRGGRVWRDVVGCRTVEDRGSEYLLHHIRPIIDLPGLEGHGLNQHG